MGNFVKRFYRGLLHLQSLYSSGIVLLCIVAVVFGPKDAPGYFGGLIVAGISTLLTGLVAWGFSKARAPQFLYDPQGLLVAFGAMMIISVAIIANIIAGMFGVMLLGIDEPLSRALAFLSAAPTAVFLGIAWYFPPLIAVINRASPDGPNLKGQEWVSPRRGVAAPPPTTNRSVSSSEPQDRSALDARALRLARTQRL